MLCYLCQKEFTNEQIPAYSCANGHSFCKTCIQEIFSSDTTVVCPQCRIDISRSQLQIGKTTHVEVFEPVEEKTIDNMNLHGQDKANELVQTQISEISYFWFKLVLISGLNWATQIVTCIYLLRLGGYFRIGFLYPILFKFYQLLRNRNLYIAGSHKLLIKQFIFGFMEELEPGEIFFYVQFAIRWILAVSGITIVQSYQQQGWDALSIAALTLNVISIYQLYISKKMLKSFLQNSIVRYQWLGSLSLVILLLVGLVTSFANVAFLVIQSYPLAIVFMICWFSVLIFSITTQKSSNCWSTVAMFLTLIVAFAYSVGMFCWLAIKHLLNRIPALTMVILRYLICPIVTLGFVVSDPESAPRSNWMLVASAVCISELSFSIFLNSRT